MAKFTVAKKSIAKIVIGLTRSGHFKIALLPLSACENPEAGVIFSDVFDTLMETYPKGCTLDLKKNLIIPKTSR